jgi:hypothetical protein
MDRERNSLGAAASPGAFALNPGGRHSSLAKQRWGLFERLLGRDVFISYSRADGANYAVALAAKLSGLGFACVIDQWGMTVPGRSTPEKVHKLLRNCRALVVVNTRAAGASVHVGDEIREFIKTPGMIIPIDLDGSIREADWWSLVEGLPIAIETGGSGALHPDASIVERLINALTFRRRDQRLRRLSFVTVSILALMVAGIVALTVASKDLAAENARTTIELDSSRGRLSAISKEAASAALSLKATNEELRVQTKALDTATQKAEQATRQVQEQQRLSRRLTAENLLSSARLQLQQDPALAALLANEASRIQPDADARSVIVQAAVSGAAWNRFPPFPSGEYHGQLTPGSNSVAGFATDTNVTAVAWIDPKRTDAVTVLDVDSGKTIRLLPLAPGEDIADVEPLARNVLVLRRPSGRGAYVRAFSFEDLLSGARDVKPRFEKYVRSFECAAGNWPCAWLGVDGRLSLVGSEANRGASVDLGEFPGSDRLTIHPSGKAIAVIEGGKLVWISVTASTDSKRAALEFNAAGEYPYNSIPMPWVRWGPQPNQLLVAEPTAPPEAHRQIPKVTLWAADPVRGIRQRLQDWDMEFNGLALPAFQTDESARRVAWSTMKKDSPSHLELLTLDWKSPPQGQLVAVSRPTKGVLRGATGSQTLYSVQAVSLAPNGGYVVIGADQRGLSGTQFGYGVVESWNLFPLDMDSSLQPESLELPLVGKRHAAKIAYSADSRRIAVLDDESNVTVFKVRDDPGPALQEGLRAQDELLARLSARTRRLDDASRIWLTTFGGGDTRLYDVTTGRETRLGDANCGTYLAAQRTGSVTAVVTEHCAVHLQGGRVVAKVKLPFSASSALISENLISTSASNEVAFLKLDDLRLFGVAQLPAATGMESSFDGSGTRFTTPNASAYLPVLSRDGREVSFLRLTDDHVMERWTARTPSSGGKLSFRRSWVRTFPKSGWTSVRALLEADMAFALFGSNDPQTRSQMFQVRLTDGAVIEHLRLPQMREQLFEVADLGRLDKDTYYAIFRIYPGGAALALWPSAGGAARAWFKLQHTEHASPGSVLGVQPHGNDKLLFVRSSDEQRAFSVRTGKLVWEGRWGANLPPPPMRRVTGKWSVAQSEGLQSVLARIGSGGGDAVDSITRIALPPQMLSRIVGQTSGSVSSGFGHSGKVAVSSSGRAERNNSAPDAADSTPPPRRSR